MDDSKKHSPGPWKIGLLLEASYQDVLKEHPMRVLEAVPGDTQSDKTTAIALCKQHLLATYDFVNEYTLPSASARQSGCVLHSADESSCHFPSVAIAPFSKTTIDHNALCQQLQLSIHDLQLNTGLPVKSVPNILLVSQHFMQTYGFFNREQVWYRDIVPLPLERVILTPCETSDSVMKHAESIAQQLYNKSKSEPMVMSQDFEYVLRAKLPVEAKKQLVEVTLEERVLTFKVLEATPTMQGVITENTTIAILPPDDYEVEVFTRSTELRTSKRRSSGRRRSSAASASEFPNEDEPDPYVESYSGGYFEDYTLEVAAATNFKLQSHCILLPKQTAGSHGIFDCQNVWVCPTSSNIVPAWTSTLDDLVLNLANEQGQGEVSSPMHSALVFAYEDEFELEQFVPPARLGVEYETTDLMRAYVHPDLLFYLYPETLSYTRRHQIVIKHCREPAPVLREMRVSEVHQPHSPTSDTTDLLHQQLRDQSLSVNTGDIITVKSDSGKQYYKVVSLDPSLNNSSVIDNSLKWECTFTPNKVYSHLPDLVPPTMSERPLFFQDIHPPGLEEHCDTLFSFIIPTFRDISSTHPRRSPSVLVTGPRGLGKRTVIRAVARRCRMNVVEINCFDFASDVAGFSEKKITVDLDKASSNAPVIIVLRNVHMMGMKDTIRQEPRLLSMFELYMSKVDQFNRTEQYPIVVVGVTSQPTLIPPRVQACFLHQLEIAPPSQPQRLAMLESLGRGYLLSPGVDLGELAKRTAGFCLGDLLALYSSAHKLSYLDVHKYCSRVNGTANSADLAVSGVVVSREHLEQALSSLHSSHADSIGAPKIPDVKWEDVGGLGDAKREILDTIQLPLLYPELFPSSLQRSGVLLYGPPGTGKTLLAKAVATECSLNFLSVKGPELINMYVGQSEENIREVFARASSAAPCVIFFDELDSIAPNRGRKGDSGGVMDRVVSQLLAELDGLNKSEHVFVIGASNRPDLIDPALLRPGRFDRMVYLGVSKDPETKLKILKAITRKFNLSPDVDLMDIASKCPPNLTGADLYSLASDAMLTALRKQIAELEKQGHNDDQWEGVLTVTREDFSESLEQLNPSLPPEELERYSSIREQLTT